jgi:ribose transport system substrate-binding protein
MKQRLIVIVGLLVLAGILGACGGDDEDGSEGAETTGGNGQEVAEVEFTESIELGVDDCYEEPESEDLTIGYANPLDANEAVNVEATAMILETERLDGEFLNVDSNGDPDQQVSDIERMVAQGVDAIIVFPLDNRALDPALKQAQDANIPVVGIEWNLDAADPGPGVDTQVWEQRDRQSYLQAKAAAEFMEPGSQYAQIGFAVQVPSIEKQVERAAFWAEKYGLESLGRVDNPTDDIAGGEKAMTEAVSQWPDMDGVIAYNEESATGASAAARAQGKRELPLIGNNGGSLGFSSVESDAIDATVQTPVVDAGRCAVWGAYDLAQGNEVPDAVVPGEPAIITQETLDDVTTWEEQLEEEYGKSSR